MTFLNKLTIHVLFAHQHDFMSDNLFYSHELGESIN